MSQWKVIFTIEAEDDLDKLDKQIRKRIIEKILWLRDNFDQVIPLPLGGRWQGFFKLRVGDWRIIHEVEDSKKQITIHYIDRRDKVYKRR
jgi:mRNA interferase RelE/StbE